MESNLKGNAKKQNSTKSKHLKEKVIKLGEGGFGSITVCLRDPTRVIKTINDPDFDMDGIQYSTLREIAASKLIQTAAQFGMISKHELDRIIQFSDIQVDDLGNVLLTMKREQCDLQKYAEHLAQTYRHAVRHSYRHAQRKRNTNASVAAATAPLTLEQCKDVMYQVAMALRVCHVLNIAHRDLKPENILLSSSSPSTSETGTNLNPETLKTTLADFGFARVVPSSSSTANSSTTASSSSLLSGNKYESNQQEQRVNPKYNQFSDIFSPGNYMCTLGYRPPELLTNTKQYSPLPVDIWSWGVMLWSLLMGTFPAELCDEVERIRIVFQRVFGQSQHIVDATTSDATVDAKTATLNSVPTKGPSQKLVNQFMSWTETEFKTRLHGPELDVIDRDMWISKLTQLYGPSIVELLQSTLMYDPSQRTSVDEILKHPCFANQRVKFGIWSNDVATLATQQLGMQSQFLTFSSTSNLDASKSKKQESSASRKHKMRRKMNSSTSNSTSNSSSTSSHQSNSSNSSKQDEDYVKLDGNDVKLAKQLFKEYSFSSTASTGAAAAAIHYPQSGWVMCIYELLARHHSKLETHALAVGLFYKIMSSLSGWTMGRQTYVLSIDSIDELHPRSLVLMIVMACCRLATKLTFSNMHLPDIQTYLSDNAYFRSWMNGHTEYTRFDPMWIFETEIWICKSLQWNLLTPNVITLTHAIAQVCNVPNSETRYDYHAIMSDYGGVSTSSTSSTQTLSSTSSTLPQPTTESSSSQTPATELPFAGAPMAAEHALLLYCLAVPDIMSLMQSNQPLLALASMNACHNPTFADNTPKSMISSASGGEKAKQFTANLGKCMTIMNISNQELHDATNRLLQAQQHMRLVVMKSRAWTPLTSLLRFFGN